MDCEVFYGACLGLKGVGLGFRVQGFRGLACLGKLYW